VLVAGLDKDARWAVEACVREALGPRASREPWTVSLVKLSSRWSVTLHGPTERTRTLSFTAEDTGLGQAIRRAIDADATAPGLAPAGVSRSTPRGEAGRLVQDSHTCRHCERPLVVAYELRPDEGKELAPVACPHCWQINHVEVGAWAASGRDYRCDKAPADGGLG
jgi:hypothetical protein